MSASRLFQLHCSFFPGEDWRTWLQSKNLAEVGLPFSSLLQAHIPFFACAASQSNFKGLFTHAVKKVNRGSIRKMIRHCVAFYAKQSHFLCSCFPGKNRQWGRIMPLMSDLYSGCLNWRPYKFLFTLCIAKGSRVALAGSGWWLWGFFGPGLRSDRPPAHQREERVRAHQWCRGCGGSVHPGALWEGEHYGTTKRMRGQHQHLENRATL